MSRTVSVEEAASHLRELLEEVRRGRDEVVIAEHGTPLARLSGMAEAGLHQRVPGSARGQIWVAPDFDDPLPDEIIESFYR